MATKPAKKTAAKPKKAAAAKKLTPAQIVKDVRKRYGDVIDLKTQPMLLIEILKQFGSVANDDGTGGVSPGTIAVGITPPGSVEQWADIQEILKAVLKLQKQVATIGKQVERVAR